MVSQRHNPTTTQVISAGWGYPERAFVEDGSFTDATVSGAEQEYGGYGFNLPFGAKVNSVKVLVKCYSTSPSYDILKVKVWDGVNWYEKKIDPYTVPPIPSTPTLITFDFTGVTDWTAGKVNTIRTRILHSFYTYASPSNFVDWIGVEVDYTTVEEVEEQAGEQIATFMRENWLPLSVLGVILAIVIAIILGVWR
ncbi:MAG: hypothetical protein ACPL1Z_05760 [Candidatus Bathyarchaeales archaeon]